MHIGSAFVPNVPGFAVLRDAGRDVRPGVRALAFVAAALCLPASAADRAPGEALTDEAIVVHRALADPRRADLKRALVSDEGNYGPRRERRRLSAEERNALNQELRAAMRGVYENRPERSR